MTYYYRLYDHIVARKWIHDQTMIIVAEVHWEYKQEFDYPDDWDELTEMGFADHNDAAVHFWLETYHNAMFEWLRENHIPWTGIQSGDTEITTNIARAFTVVCVVLRDPNHVTQFMLAWG